MPRSYLARRIGKAVRNSDGNAPLLPQENLGKVIGVHRTYLGVLERGQGNPTIDTLERAALALGGGVRDRAAGRRNESAAASKAPQSDGIAETPSGG